MGRRWKVNQEMASVSCSRSCQGKLSSRGFQVNMCDTGKNGKETPKLYLVECQHKPLCNTKCANLDHCACTGVPKDLWMLGSVRRHRPRPAC